MTASFHDILVNSKKEIHRFVFMIFKLFHEKARVSGSSSKVSGDHDSKVVMSCHAMTVSISHGYHD